MCFMMSAFGRISAASDHPVLENAIDVPPASAVVAHGLDDRVFDPLRRVGLECVDQPFGNERREQSNVLLVQAEDRRALGLNDGGYSVLPEVWWRSGRTATHRRHLRLIGDRVDIVPNVAFASVRRRHPEQCPTTDREVQTDADPAIRLIGTPLDSQRSTKERIARDRRFREWMIETTGIGRQTEDRQRNLDLGDI